LRSVPRAAPATGPVPRIAAPAAVAPYARGVRQVSVIELVVAHRMLPAVCLRIEWKPREL
jgi:hypothetical protein